MKLLVTIIALASTFVASAQLQNIWSQKDSIKGAPRRFASSFVAQGEGYTLCGLDANGYRRSMNSYSDWENDWDAEQALGGVNGSGQKRAHAAAFAVQNKGYICLGQGETAPFMPPELWEYDPTTGAWTQKADFIGSPRRMSVGFAIDSFGYVGLGYSLNGFEKDMYKYSPSTNTWTQLNDFAGTARQQAVGFAMGGQGYVGTGDDGVYRKDFWQYSPSTDSWNQLTDFPSTARAGAVGWGQFPQAFICLGEDINNDFPTELWEYNFYSNTWAQRADFPASGRKGAISFVLNGIAYVGSGWDGMSPTDDVYAYNKVVGIDELEQYSNISVYPNPTVDQVKIDITTKDLVLRVFSIDGKEVTSSMEIEESFDGYHIKRNGIPTGEYIISVNHKTMGPVLKEKIVFI